MGDRAYKLRKRYSIKESVYDDILKGQGGKCKICGEHHTEDRRLHVDHSEDGDEKCVNGLICNLCNGMLAFAKHDPKILEAGINYLKRR